MKEKTYTVYASQLRASEVKQFWPIQLRDGEEVILRRYFTEEGILDEYIVDVSRVEEGKVCFTIGVVQKRMTSWALKLIDSCPSLAIAKFEEEIPYVLYRGCGTNVLLGGSVERLQYLERDKRPMVAWIELVDPNGKPIVGTSWRPDILPR